MKIKSILTVALLLAAFTVLSLVPSPGSRIPDVQAATKNPSPASPGYTPMVIPIFGKYTGATAKTGVVKWKAPVGYRVVAANATARASSGTNPTLKIRGMSSTYVNYSGSLTAGTVKDLTITTNKLADETVQAIDLVVGGTSTPTWSDITLMLLLKQL